MRTRLLWALGALAALAAVAYAGWAWHYAVHYVSTDDAYVEGTITPVSAKVSGHVAALLVGDNQPVKEGELLLRIDPRDYQARVAQARAAVSMAEANLKAARSELPLAREETRAVIDQARATLEGAVVAVRASESAVDEARARLESRRAAAGRELERFRQLLQSELVARRDFDAAEAVYETTSATVEATERRLAQAEREIQQAQAELASRAHAVDQAKQRVAEARAALARAESQLHQVAIKDAAASQAEARLRETQADLAFAELQLQYTEVRTPIDGVVSKRSVEVGQVVQMGQPLLAIVPLHDVWVLANFKETQVSRIRPGMRAEVWVDGVPDRAFTGSVNSLSAGTGARFSLLPPENATGNWVKVVQRVPVKILLDAREFGNPHTLRAGMSVIVTIRVR